LEKASKPEAEDEVKAPKSKGSGRKKISFLDNL
jgi:hypothetical protein